MNNLKTMSNLKWVLLFIGASFLFFLLYGITSSFWYEFAERNAEIPGAIITFALTPLIIWTYRGWQKRLEHQEELDGKLKDLCFWTAKGFALGFFIFALTVLLMTTLGVYKIDHFNANWKSPLCHFLVFTNVAVGEEVLFRGILFRMIDKRWNTIAAITSTALLFGLTHLPNDNATLWSAIAIAIEAGILLGVVYKWAGNIWYPIGLHWAWNFSQGCIFGFNVSGTYSGVPLITPTCEGPDLLTGGAFGAEASIITVLVGLATAIYYWRKLKNINK